MSGSAPLDFRVLIALAVPAGIVGLVAWLSLSGAKTNAEKFQALRDVAARRGLHVREGATLQDFAASGEVRGVEVHAEQRFIRERRRPSGHQSDVRAKPRRPLPELYVVPLLEGTALPDAPPGLRVVELGDAEFDAGFRCFARDESAARTVLDARLRGKLGVYLTSSARAELRSLRVSSGEVTLSFRTLLGWTGEAFDSALELVVDLCG
jgi:hypothetical protein